MTTPQTLKSKVLLLFFAIAALSFQATAQVNLRTSTGFAGYGSPIDGFFFSFDIGFPTVKGIEVNPSFTFHTNAKHEDLFYFLDGSVAETSITETTTGSLAGDLELFVTINPFRWLKNEKWNKVDFGIGAGYGVKIFSEYRYYHYDGGIDMRMKSGIMSTYSAKMFYNYHFKKYYLGVVLGAKELNDDGVSILGLQFGLSLD